MSNLIEVWKPVKGYEGRYEVSSLGRVKSLERYVANNKNGGQRLIRERILKQHIGSGRRGYPAIVLSKHSLYKTSLIHRLVAQAFIPNHENKLEVNHIDGIKTNSKLENLEWVTCSENHAHAFRIGLKSRDAVGDFFSKSVRQLTMEGKLVKVWKSTMEARRKLGIQQSNISRCCTGERNHAGGFIWKHAEK